eukprot:jgi/Chrpa1/5390/Chrysochromulina_OHIO_Genome00014564-RA
MSLAQLLALLAVLQSAAAFTAQGFGSCPVSRFVAPPLMWIKVVPEEDKDRTVRISTSATAPAKDANAYALMLEQMVVDQGEAEEDGEEAAFDPDFDEDVLAMMYHRDAPASKDEEAALALAIDEAATAQLEAEAALESRAAAEAKPAPKPKPKPSPAPRPRPPPPSTPPKAPPVTSISTGGTVRMKINGKQVTTQGPVRIGANEGRRGDGDTEGSQFWAPATSKKAPDTTPQPPSTATTESSSLTAAFAKAVGAKGVGSAASTAKPTAAATTPKSKPKPKPSTPPPPSETSKSIPSQVEHTAWAGTMP